MNATGQITTEPVAFPTRYYRRIASWRAYPRSFLLVALGSRWAKPVSWIFWVAALIVGALGDFGEKTGWWWMIAFVVLMVAAQAWTTLVEGATINAYHGTLKSVATIISSMAGVESQSDPRIIHALLQRAREVADATVRCPKGHRITANLLLPEYADGNTMALRVTAADDYHPDRRHDPIPLDAPGAPESFLSGNPVAINNTENCSHQRIRGGPYKSIAAFPIWVGEPASAGAIVGVLSLDSTHPYTFEQKATEQQLYPFVAPIAQLIGFALELRTREEERNGEEGHA